MEEKNIILSKGLLKNAELNGIVFEDFGIEFSDRFSFFTLTEKSRFVIYNLIQQEDTTNSSKAVYSINTVEGVFELEILTTTNFL